MNINGLHQWRNVDIAPLIAPLFKTLRQSCNCPKITATNKQ